MCFNNVYSSLFKRVVYFTWAHKIWFYQIIVFRNGIWNYVMYRPYLYLPENQYKYGRMIADSINYYIIVDTLSTLRPGTATRRLGTSNVGDFPAPITNFESLGRLGDQSTNTSQDLYCKLWIRLITASAEQLRCT